jgi:AbiV family abortive infection protein
MGDMPADDQLRAAIEACIANADELISGARNLAAAGSPRLAYHLGVMALEEVGKSSILGMRHIAKEAGRELPNSIAKGLDDHVRKLFWAIWGPSMGRELVTKEQIDSNIGLAQRLHDRRLRGLYVDADEQTLSVPTNQISPEEADSLLRFVEASIEIGRSRHADEASDDPDSIARREWFFEVTEDPERRSLVFGAKSMETLKELGSVHDWAAWLKKTFEDNEAEARAALDRELQRRPGGGGASERKWRTTIRLYTPSHSIRQKPLNKINEGLDWTRFRAVSGKNDQLQIDLYATGDLTLDRLYRSGLVISRRLVMALNVATLGYFWFHNLLDVDPKQSGRFYESMTDLQTKMDLRIHRSPPLRIDHGRARVLEAADLNRWALIFGHLLRYEKPIELNICERYLDGLTMIAKSDAHMAFEIQAVVAFYLAFRDAMKLYGAWTEGEEFSVAMKRFAAEGLKTVDDEHFDRLAEVGESVNSGRGVPHAMTMNDVGVMKAFCDVFLIRTFQRLGPGAPDTSTSD